MDDIPTKKYMAKAQQLIEPETEASFNISCLKGPDLPAGSYSTEEINPRSLPCLEGNKTSQVSDPPKTRENLSTTAWNLIQGRGQAEPHDIHLDTFTTFGQAAASLSVSATTKLGDLKCISSMKENLKIQRYQETVQGIGKRCWVMITSATQRLRSSSKPPMDDVHLQATLSSTSHTTHEPLASYSRRLDGNTGESDVSAIRRLSRRYSAPAFMISRNRSPQDSLSQSAVGLLPFNKGTASNQSQNNLNLGRPKSLPSGKNDPSSEIICRPQQKDELIQGRHLLLSPRLPPVQQAPSRETLPEQSIMPNAGAKPDNLQMPICKIDWQRKTPQNKNKVLNACRQTTADRPTNIRETIFTVSVKAPGLLLSPTLVIGIHDPTTVLKKEEAVSLQQRVPPRPPSLIQASSIEKRTQKPRAETRPTYTSTTMPAKSEPAMIPRKGQSSRKPQRKLESRRQNGQKNESRQKHHSEKSAKSRETTWMRDNSQKEDNQEYDTQNRDNRKQISPKYDMQKHHREVQLTHSFNPPVVRNKGLINNVRNTATEIIGGAAVATGSGSHTRSMEYTTLHNELYNESRRIHGINNLQGAPSNYSHHYHFTGKFEDAMVHKDLSDEIDSVIFSSKSGHLESTSFSHGDLHSKDGQCLASREKEEKYEIDSNSGESLIDSSYSDENISDEDEYYEETGNDSCRSSIELDEQDGIPSDEVNSNSGQECPTYTYDGREGDHFTKETDNIAYDDGGDYKHGKELMVYTNANEQFDNRFPCSSPTAPYYDQDQIIQEKSSGNNNYSSKNEERDIGYHRQTQEIHTHRYIEYTERSSYQEYGNRYHASEYYNDSKCHTGFIYDGNDCRYEGSRDDKGNSGYCENERYYCRNDDGYHDDGGNHSVDTDYCGNDNGGSYYADDGGYYDNDGGYDDSGGYCDDGGGYYDDDGGHCEDSGGYSDY